MQGVTTHSHCTCFLQPASLRVTGHQLCDPDSIPGLDYLLLQCPAVISNIFLLLSWDCRIVSFLSILHLFSSVFSACPKVCHAYLHPVEELLSPPLVLILPSISFTCEYTKCTESNISFLLSLQTNHCLSDQLKIRKTVTVLGGIHLWS